MDTQKDPRAALKTAVLRLERATNANMSARAKYAGKPERFVDSELELEDAIRDLQTLSAADERQDGESAAGRAASSLPDEWVRLGVLASLTALLDHENSDIAVAVIECLDDFTSDIPGEEPSSRAVLDALFEAGLCDALVSNMGRAKREALSEGPADGTDGAAAYEARDQVAPVVLKTMALLENLVELDAAFVCEQLCTRHASALPLYLLQQLMDEDGSTPAQRVSCAELLAVLVQGGGIIAAEGLLSVGVVSLLVRALTRFRAPDNVASDSAEGVEREEARNLIDALSGLLLNAPSSGSAQFVGSDGIELLLLILQSRPRLRRPCLQALDLTLVGGGRIAVTRFFDVGGVGSVFAAWTGKRASTETRQAAAGILATVFSVLDESTDKQVEALRQRLVKKFADSNGAKIEFAVAECRRLWSALGEDALAASGPGVAMGEDAYLERLDKGLLALQTGCMLVASLLLGGCEPKKIRELLRSEDKGQDFDSTAVANILRERAEHTGTSDDDKDRLRLIRLADAVTGLN